MEPFLTVEAPAIPIDQANVDTDQIIPARYLSRARDEGFADTLFHDLRERPDGHIVDDPAYAGAAIIVADRNFGCGSSREPAVYALADFGIRVVIAPSFGDIFFNNCLKNGLLPIVLSAAQVQDLFAPLTVTPGTRLTVDLENQTIRAADGLTIRFDMDEKRKRRLLLGLDEIGVTLALADEIARFEAAH